MSAHKRWKHVTQATAVAAAMAVIGACSSSSTTASSPAAATSAGASSAAPAASAAAASSPAAAASSPAAAANSVTAAAPTGPLPTVKLQLKWFSQGQFAGYLAAAAMGFYKQQGLNVDIVNGGPDIESENAVATGKTDFAVSWVPNGLSAREAGANLVDVAQIFQRAGLQEYSFKKENITSPADLKGKKVGVNGAGNDVDVLAALSKYNLTPGKDVTLEQQQGSIKGLLTGDIDAAQGASYNEYGQLLSTENPATGQLYTAADFNILDWNTYGTAMLEDGIWADSSKLASSPTYQKETQEFVTGSLEGWIYCRDNVAACRDIVVKSGSSLGASLQLFQVNSVNQLVWPAPNGIGVVDPTTWNQTVQIALGTKETDGTPLLKTAPAAGGYSNTYVDQALATLKAMGLDVTGATYKPTPVVLKLNGQ